MAIHVDEEYVRAVTPKPLKNVVNTPQDIMIAAAVYHPEDEPDRDRGVSENYNGRLLMLDL